MMNEVPENIEVVNNIVNTEIVNSIVNTNIDDFVMDKEKKIKPLQPGKDKNGRFLTKEHYTFYGKGGNEVEESESLAKLASYTNGAYYYLWMVRGDIYDPYGMDILRRATSKYVRVNRIIFENYVKYLKSKNKAFYNIARREQMKREK